MKRSPRGRRIELTAIFMGRPALRAIDPQERALSTQLTQLGLAQRPRQEDSTPMEPPKIVR